MMANRNTCNNTHCDNDAEYYDIMDNKLCAECVEEAIVEFGADKNDFEAM